MVISNEDVQKIKNYTEDVKSRSLKYEIELKDNEIGHIKNKQENIRSLVA